MASTTRQPPEGPGGGAPEETARGAGTAAAAAATGLPAGGRPMPQRADDDAIDLRALMMPVWRHRWLVLACTLVAAAAGAAAGLAIPPSYTAAARVIYEPERLRIVDLDGAVASADTSRAGLQNQIEILSSTALLERVAGTLDLGAAPGFAAPPGGAGAGPDGLRRRAGDLLGRLGAGDILDRLGAGGLLDRLGLSPAPLAPPAAALSPEEAAEARRAGILHRLQTNLSLRPVRDSRVIEIAFTAPDPRLAAAIVNAAAEGYIGLQSERRRADAAAATEILGIRVRELEARSNAAEEAVRLAQLELSLGAEFGSALIAAQLEALNGALAEARLARAALEDRHERAAAALAGGEDLHVIPDFRDAPAVAAMRAREIGLQDEEASARALLANRDSAALLRIRARLGELRETMREEAARIVEGLRREADAARGREAALEAQFAALERRAVERSRAEIRIGRLEREAAASRTLHDGLSDRMNRVTEQAALQAPEARILGRAAAPRAPDPSPGSRLVLLAALAGAGLAVGLVLMLERLNDTFRSPADVEARTGLAVFAGIPGGRRRGARALLAAQIAEPEGPLAESTRNLRTSILFSNIDRSPRVVMFASSLPGEGKTTTAILTAVATRQMERSAIIVDCDLRRRTLGSVFPLSPEQPGLFAVLQDAASLEEATWIEPETGLHVLAPERAARGLGNPADVLASRRFARLIAGLKARYDLVILDTPPVLAVADARIVAPLADAVIYAARWNATRRGAVVEGIRELGTVGARVAGVVLTRVDPRRAARYADEHLTKSAYGPYRRA